MKEIEQKNELNRIISKNVEIIKQEYKSKQKNNENTFNKEMRAHLIDSILTNDTILTVVYDKTFYPDFKDIKINEDDEEN